MINPDVNADPTNWTTVRKWELNREGPEDGQADPLQSKQLVRERHGRELDRQHTGE